MLTPNQAERLRQHLRESAAGLGFCDIGFTDATISTENRQGLNAWLQAGHHGSMQWMQETALRRTDPKTLMADAATAIVLVMNYGPDHDPMLNLRQSSFGNISVYARGRDYHQLVKGRLKQLAGALTARSRQLLSADSIDGAAAKPPALKVFVDTAPLMEKPLAARAGLGWQGKHTNLVSRGFGSWLFIGVILTNLPLAETADAVDHCGSCTACLDICPTAAFPEPYKLDARRCISYLTIEHDGQIPLAFRAAMGNRIFGCDDCLAVCPWNRFANQSAEMAFAAADSGLPPLADLLALDEAGYRKRFAGTPVRRAGYVRFLRNVVVAAGNSGDTTLVGPLEKLLHHQAHLVRGMAVWALRQLLPAADFSQISQTHLPMEKDSSVIAEWQGTPS